MRIGYVMQTGVPDLAQRPPSGAAVHVRCSIEELARLGHDVRLVVARNREIHVSDDLSDYRRVPVPRFDEGPIRVAERGIRRVQSELRLPYIGAFESLRFADACVRELCECDLIYERMGWMGWGGMRAASRLGVPHILEVNGDHLPEHDMLGVGPKGVQRLISLRLMSHVARRARHTVATGEGWRQRHIERWNVDPDSITMVQNGTRLVELLDRVQLRSFEEHGDPKRPVRVVYVGSFDPWQNLPSLLAAFARVVAAGHGAELILAGSGHQEVSLRETVAQLGIESDVQFVGQLLESDLAQLLAKADIGVSVYHRRVEYTGLKLLDYKAAGLATIATGKAGEPSLVTHGHTGLIIPPDDEDALCKALCRLVSDRRRLREMGRLARVEAEKKHHWKHTAQELDRLFHRFVPARRRSSRAEIAAA